MKLEQKRIRNSKRLLKDINELDDFFLASELTPKVKATIQKIEGWVDWDHHPNAFFPSPLYGKMSVRNAEGEFIPDKTKPKEIAYRAQEWELRDWGGNFHSGLSHVPYQRYPRDFIPPVEFQLAIKKDHHDNTYAIIDHTFSKAKEDERLIVFGANLLLEMLGNVIAYTPGENNDEIPTPTHFETVNWEILPKGERIWDAVNSNERGRLSRSEQSMLQQRFDFIMSHQPDNVYRGIGGYDGYFVFDFPKEQGKHYYIFDSMLYGMATYVFDGDWREISKLTKKEILTQHIQLDRLIHNDGWAEKLRTYLG